MGRLFKKLFNRKSSIDNNGIKQFCQTEWGKDWYYAYTCYQKDGKFPYHVRRSVY